jgi:nitrate reductase assembly molybdenum cofactor insertion protein NarJ
MTMDNGLAQEPEAVGMDVDGEELPPKLQLSLNVLQTIKTAQAQHGLRHSDYTRYRHVRTSPGGSDAGA